MQDTTYQPNQGKHFLEIQVGMYIQLRFKSVCTITQNAG